MEQRRAAPSKKAHAPCASRAAIVPSSKGMIHALRQQAPA
jgi:hypothetical protein